MNKLLLSAVGVAATMALSAPAQAAHTVCTAAQLANAAGATSCYFVAGNANSNSAAHRTLQQTAIGALGATTFTYNFGAQADNSFKDGTGHTSLGTSVGFGTDMFGETIVGMHFGGGRNSPFGQGPGGFTAFYLFNFASPTSTITLTNVNSLSNAHLYATSTNAVPEPATWAMLILGFGAVGGAMRSASKRRTTLAFG